MYQENDKHGKTVGKSKTKIDGLPLHDQLNSDNAFSDKGLDNAQATKKAVNKDNSSH